MNKSLLIECLRKWAGVWLGKRVRLIDAPTDSSPRDIGATCFAEQHFIALGAQHLVHKPAHRTWSRTQRGCYLGYLRGVGYGRRALCLPTYSPSRRCP
jgi:hypothetical protein